MGPRVFHLLIALAGVAGGNLCAMSLEAFERQVEADLALADRAYQKDYDDAQYVPVTQHYFGPNISHEYRTRALAVFNRHHQLRRIAPALFKQASPEVAQKNGAALLSVVDSDTTDAVSFLAMARYLSEAQQSALYQKAIGLVGKSKGESPMASYLAYYGPELKKQPLTVPEMKSILKAGGFSRDLVKELTKQDPDAGTAVVQVFHKKGSFKGLDTSSYFVNSDADSVTALIQEGKLPLSPTAKNSLRAAILDESVDPDTKEEAYKALWHVDPDLARATFQQLSTSSSAILHLNAASFYPNGDAGRLKVLEKDLRTSRDLNLMADIARELDSLKDFSPTLPSEENAAWTQRWLEHPFPQARVLALRKIAADKTTHGNFPALFKSLMDFNRIDSFRQEESYDALEKAFESIPEEVKANGPMMLSVLDHPSLSQNQRGILLSAIAKSPTPQAIPPFLKILHTASDPLEWMKRRFDLKSAAEGLGNLLRENPALLTPELAEKLGALLASKDVAMGPAASVLRKHLPRSLVDKIDAAQWPSLIHPSNADSCKVVCRIADHFSTTMEKGWSIKPDLYLRGASSSSFELAVNALVADFLVKAETTGCRVPGLDGKIKDLVAPEGTKPTPQDTSAKEDKREMEKRLKDSGLDKEALDRALAFLEEAGEFSASDPEALPTSSGAIFSVVHLGRLLNSLERAGKLKNTDSVKQLKEQVNSQLSKIISQRNKLQRDNNGNSLFAAYHFAAAVLGFAEGAGGTEGKKLGVEALSEERDAVKKQTGETNRFGYYLKSQRGPTETGKAGGTTRGAAARSVVAQLAIFDGQGADQKLANADELLRSVQNYNRHFFEIFDGIGEHRTHDNTDDDRMAPYYGPATVPYAFEAIARLEKEKGTTSEQRAQIQTLRKELEGKLLVMFQDDGLFRKQSSDYSGAPIYDNALTGLALAEACAHKQSDKPKGSPDQNLARGGAEKPTTGHQ